MNYVFFGKLMSNGAKFYNPVIAREYLAKRHKKGRIQNRMNCFLVMHQSPFEKRVNRQAIEAAGEIVAEKENGFIARIPDPKNSFLPINFSQVKIS